MSWVLSFIFCYSLKYGFALSPLILLSSTLKEISNLWYFPPYIFLVQVTHYFAVVACLKSLLSEGCLSCLFSGSNLKSKSQTAKHSEGRCPYVLKMPLYGLRVQLPHFTLICFPFYMHFICILELIFDVALLYCRSSSPLQLLALAAIVVLEGTICSSW